jgi:Asp-tRNA(Asn)/Glu-tRNA(Gln) amidotransferase A subunit family amidase
VKDNFDIKGLQTSACNRAFYELYPPAPKTAAAIQTLYDQGAVIVGSTKLASFAATEEPVECIDWQAPWNPRADEYQSPAGSSSGSGVAASRCAQLMDCYPTRAFYLAFLDSTFQRFLAEN